MQQLEKMLATALLVPMGNGGANSGPNDPDCIWGLPLLLWGSPGIGKSARIRAAGKAVGLPVESVIPATRAPEDFSGVPMIRDGQLSIECILGAVTRLCKYPRGGVLFIDEISCAVPAVQSALLSVVLDRCVGETVLPRNVRILSAANPPEEAAGGWDLELPTANRFAHLKIAPPTADEWIAWLTCSDNMALGDIANGENFVKQNWIDVWPRVVGIMVGFMRQFRSSLHLIPKEGSKERGRAWPSPRSWDFAARAVATCYATDVPASMAYDFVQACVGEGPATSWVEWVSKADLPDPYVMVTKGWTPDKLRLDRTMAAFVSMAEYVVSRPDPKEKIAFAAGAWKVLAKACELGISDTAGMPAKRLINAQLGSSAGGEVAQISAPVMLRLGRSGQADLLKGVQ